MAYPSPRRLQLRRGNAAAIASYLGYTGELVVNTSAWTLYVHDGVTVGGYAATVNTAVITTQITSVNANITIANVGMKGYVDQGNSIQAAAITSSNIGMRGYVDATIRANIANIAVASTYSNVNVRTYLGSFDGNIIPSANNVYSLGSVTNQWKDLFVSNNTIYVGGVPLGIDATGNLTVNGNVIPTISYVNTVVANVVVDLSSYALNANVTAANVGLKGYVDQANTIQGAQLTSANLGIIGYIDQANTIQSAQISAANVGLKGYVDQANSIQSAQVGAANLAITAANVGMKGYVDSQSFYSNVKVATYLPTYDGNIAANISKAGYTWTFGTGGTTQFPNSLILAPVSQSITMQSDQYSQLMWENANLTVAPNMAINSNFYVAQNSATLDIGYRDGSSTQLIKSWYWSVDGNLKLPSGGYILNSDDSIYGAGSSYSNVEVATYLQSGNIANVSVAGNVTATYFVGNGAFLTGVVGSASNYGNIDVKAFLGTDAGFADGYQRVIEGYYANIILGDTTKLFSYGSSAKSYFGHEGSGNTQINYVRADNGDVRIATNNAAYTWIFDNGGNLTLSGNTFSVNYANGTPVTFSSSSYSNVQVAAYLNTQGYNLYSNVNVASYLSTATINTTGNITAANFVGNISITGNVTGTSANVTLVAGSYSSIFDNQGNVTVPRLFTAGNIQTAGYFVGNGTLLTGVAIKTTGSWTVPTGNSTQSFTVPTSGTYQLWVDCNIPNGILAWNAIATVTNSNVPVVGQQFAWVYNGGGTPIDFTSIPNQFVGTGNTIVRSSVSPSVTTNRFDFGINNTSGGNVTVSYGYVKIS